MSTTPHPYAPEEIMAHLDGELSAARAQSVSAHIETCAACQELVTSLRNTSQSLSNWTVGSAPASIENHVMPASAKFPFLSGSMDLDWSPLTHRWTRKQWIGGLAAILAAAVLLLSISVPTLHRSQPALERTRGLMVLREKKAQPRNSLPVDSARINSAGEQQDDDKKTYSLDGSVEAPSAPPPSAGPQAVNAYKPWLSGGSGGGFAPSQAVVDQKAEMLEGPMIARAVTLALLVKDFDSARASLDIILARHNGYAATLGLSTPQGTARSLQASLRIPAPQLASALAELRSVGHVETEMQNSEEVTRQHADLVARLKNSRETEVRLQAILMQRTGKISDVLAVEQEIARVRGEIEQMEAEQKNLEHRVSFATIDLSFSEEYKAKLDPATPSISTQIHNAAVNGYRNVSDTLLSIVLFFAEYGPVLAFWLLLLAVPATLVWRRWRHAAAAI
jgi:anti-sigma factor RsiW